MKKFLKWTGIVLGAVLIIGLLTAFGLSASASQRLNKTYTVEPEVVVIPSDPESIAEGERLTSIYCQGCHAADLGGKDFFNDPALAVVYSSNLTPGAGGVGAVYTDEDWVRAIRHGVGPEGRPLFIMPSGDFYYFSDEQLGQIIAYLKTVPPVDREPLPLKTGFMGRVLTSLGMLGNVFNAETIDHDVRPDTPPRGETAEYGEYLANTIGCKTCHGEELAGGSSPDPESPPAPNLTPAGNLANFTDEVFINFIRARQSDFMPFESMAKMSDQELSAIWLYLQSLPSVETNE